MTNKTFVFDNYEESILQQNIAEFENTTGKEVTKLECNSDTAYNWTFTYRERLKYSHYDKHNGVYGRYDGIPIAINQKLKDGVISIS
ncbi:MAG: hypothetical protein Q4E61_02580 [Alphaproteobacteria bacterium]|nr:hypothetical protein [Alphaproteobacteria bacterium]